MHTQPAVSANRRQPASRPPVPANLTLAEALCLADFVTGKRDRQAVRNILVLHVTAMLPPGQTAAEHARQIARDLREPDTENQYCKILRAIRRLSRGGGPISQDRLEKVLNASLRQ